jgi:protein-disulfide isomerase
MGEALQFVFRHFPLAMIYPHAEMAAEVAEAAGVQGKFRDMHHLLYSRQDRLDFVALTEYAEAVGLDTVRFRDDLEAHAYAGKVAEDFMSGVNGTPSFFINGRRHNGSYEFDDLAAASETHLSASRRTSRSITVDPPGMVSGGESRWN